MQQDHKATEEWYTKEVSFKEILQGGVPVPNAQAKAFLNAMENAKETAKAQ